MNFQEHFSIDKEGNLYFDDKWIYINRYDNIDFYQIKLNKNIKKISNDIKTKEDPLQIKVIEEELKDIKERFVDSDNLDDFGENEVMHFQNYLYNPEFKYIRPTFNTSDEEIDVAPYILINGNFNKIETEFDISNYEVFIVDSYNNLLCYTEIVNDNPLYRITIYSNNRIELNIIGTKSILYEIIFDSNNQIQTKVLSIQYQNLK
jgi:hypothetical protein